MVLAMVVATANAAVMVDCVLSIPCPFLSTLCFFAALEPLRASLIGGSNSNVDLNELLSELAL